MILLVFVSITAYSLNAESKTDIEVEEGFKEIKVELPPYPQQKKLEKRVTATSNITAYNDGDNSIELTVIPLFWKVSLADLRISVDSNFESALKFDNLIIKAKTLEAPDINESHLDFQMSSLKTPENLDLWEHSNNRYGSTGKDPAFVGFNILENNFNLSDFSFSPSYPEIDHEKKGLNSPWTIEIIVVARGTPKDIETSIQITFIQEGLVG